MKNSYIKILFSCFILAGCEPSLMVTPMGNNQFHVSCDDTPECRSKAVKKARETCGKDANKSQLHLLSSNDGKYHIVINCDWEPEL